ncbi:hypothetical protein GOP47_0022632 [Adiantum capillus-veneris]|uniref:Uncharacterized protein n=1 Tax=Adiantum capillus-veneris TaxID=13818 RepID=A0A9D4Z4G1_ADICA|nr:hypothetical protein GOP47_0022632 [Adiantum capillus-veneris]
MATKITQNPTLRNAALFAMKTLWAVPAIAAEVAEDAEPGDSAIAASFESLCTELLQGRTWRGGHGKAHG